VLPRFYAPTLTAGDETVALEADEATHLTRVLRIPPGREVVVFNGRGTVCRARVELADKRGVVLRVLSAGRSAPELPFPLTLAHAVLKGDGMDEVVRNAVLLGVSAVVPVITSRSEVSASQISRARRVDRWRRIAISSAKQCGRAIVPVLGEPADLDGALVAAKPARLVMLVEPEASPDARGLDELPRGTPADGAWVFVGPEGGWAPEEISRAAEAGALPLTLGRLTLRADIAATIALPVLRYCWGAL
jgi:16S rRNA (uracil1498-N3)-methyltransferase